MWTELGVTSQRFFKLTRIQLIIFIPFQADSTSLKWQENIDGDNEKLILLFTTVLEKEKFE